MFSTHGSFVFGQDYDIARDDFVIISWYFGNYRTNLGASQNHYHEMEDYADHWSSIEIL